MTGVYSEENKQQEEKHNGTTYRQTNVFPKTPAFKIRYQVGYIH
jgi:hypothetical protein